MDKFKIVVTRNDEYEISIDPSVWSQDELKSWSNVFHDVETREELARSLGQTMARLGSDYGFFEGFGYVKQLRADGSERKQSVDSGKFSKGLLVKVISEDEEIEVDSEKIKS